MRLLADELFSRRFFLSPPQCPAVGLVALLCAAMLFGAPSSLRAQPADDAVIEAMLAYVDSNPQDLARRQALVDRLLREGRVEAARAQLETLVDIQPGAPSILRQLATLYDWTNRPEAARATYERLSRLRPNDASLHRELAQRYRWAGQIEQSIEHMERVVALQPNNPTALYDLAQQHLWANNPDRARALLTDLLDDTPDNLAARRTLANLYFWTEQSAQGIDQLEWIVSYHPWDLETRERLAQHYYWTDQPAKGHRQLEALLQHAPGRDSLRRELMQRYFDYGQSERGLHHLETLVERHPADTSLRRLLAQRYLWADRLQDNIEQLERLLAHAPADTTVRRTLAERLFANNQPERGLHHLEVLVEQHPDDRPLRSALATRYTEMGRTEAAIEQYQWFVAHPPAPSSMKTRLLQYLLWEQRYDEVTSYGDPILAAAPDPERRWIVAQAYAWSDRPQAALSHLDTLLADAPEHTGALLLAGELRRWSPTEWPSSYNHLRRALALVPDTTTEAHTARHLLHGLRRDYGSTAQTRIRRETDSNGRTHTYAPLRTELRLGGLWRGIVEAGVHRFHDDELAPGAAALRGYGGTAGVQTRFSTGTALHLAGAATVYASGWSAFGGTVRVQQPLGPITLTTQYQRQEARESVSALRAKIQTHRLQGQAELQLGERLMLLGEGTQIWYSDDNRRLNLGGTARLQVVGAPFTLALLGRYRYEDTEQMYPDSRPYWTPNQLHTLSGALSLDVPVAPWLHLGATYGLSSQDDVLGHDYGGRLRLSTGFHSVQASLERFGSGTYAYRAFAVQYAYRF